MRYTLRPTTTDDYEYLRRLHHAAYHDLMVQMFGGWHEDEQDRYFDDHYVAGAAQIIVVEGDDVGAVEMGRDGVRWFIAELQIDPAWQGRGIGTAVLRDVLARADAEGVPVSLHVLKENRARRLYERLGFVTTGEMVHHYLMATMPAEES